MNTKLQRLLVLVAGVFLGLGLAGLLESVFSIQIQSTYYIYILVGAVFAILSNQKMK